ncbi:Endopolyphosphatase [Phlyctochytrium bullatum]|nr:Endopolyphosphatase [Phlyctochytrium bullatum]
MKIWICLAPILGLLIASLSEASPTSRLERRGGHGVGKRHGGTGSNVDPGEHLHFLHITDFHIDPLFNPKADPDSKCHGKDVSRAKRSPPGYYGIPSSGCDSPPLLVNETFRYIRDTMTLRNGRSWLPQLGGGRKKGRAGDGDSRVAFVLWTGDSSRHDRDGKIPKTEREVFEANEDIVRGFLETFNVSAVPIIPSIGNWDTFPAGELAGHPNDPTFARLWAMWSPLFPYGDSETAVAKGTFHHGGYFARTLVPGKLSAVSLNTLSFFESNDLLDGDCAPFVVPRPKGGAGEGMATESVRRRIQRDVEAGRLPHPGDVQLAWLEDRLLEARRRVTRVMVIGHVPPLTPEETLYLPSCLDWFTYLSGEYSDVVLMQYFGHINRDILHLVLSRRKLDGLDTERPSNPYHLLSLTPKTIVNDLDLNLYGITSLYTTSASVVPAYFPGFRTGTLLLASSATPSDPVTLIDQSTYFADISKWNKKRDRVSHDPSASLQYATSCSTLRDYGIPTLSPRDVEAWAADMKALMTGGEGAAKAATKGLRRAMKRYAKCMEVSYDLATGRGERVGFDDPLVQKIVWTGVVVIAVAVVFGVVKLAILCARSSEPERTPLLFWARG